MSVMRALLLLALALLASFGLAAPAYAQLAFSLRTGNNATGTQSMVFDSNKGCHATTQEGPRGMFLGGTVTNNGATAATNVVATLSGLTSNFYLAGGQPAVLNLGTIAPGGSAGAFWFLGYNCAETSATLNVAISSSAGSSSSNVTVTGTSTLSANATGFLETTTLGPGAVVGQTIYLDVQYSFGGTDVGSEFYLQPTGLQNFNAACFRLVGNQITQSAITGIPVGSTNRTHFLQTAKQTQKSTVTSRYFFAYLCEGASTTVRPYAMGTSGQSLKYTGNYDSAATSFTITFPGATNPFTITKTQSLAQAYINARPVVKYTVTVNNPSVHNSRISDFVDTLPPGAEFVGLDPTSDVTAANSSLIPAAGATGTITFTGRQDLSYLIAPGGSVKLVYLVKMPSPEGTYVNSATGRFGQATTPTASVTFTVIPPPPITVIKSSQVASDPVNGTGDPKAIPGARMTYTIAVMNPNDYVVTNNSIAVVDATPAGLDAFVGDVGAAGTGPVAYADGSPASGLTYSYQNRASQTDNIDFSDDGGATWDYVPTPNAEGADPAVTHVRVRPQGAMSAASSFSLFLNYVIE